MLHVGKLDGAVMDMIYRGWEFDVCAGDLVKLFQLSLLIIFI